MTELPSPDTEPFPALGRTLVCVPTYDERENVGPLIEQISALNLDLDLMFIDDNSPDGTGQLLDELASKFPRLTVIHRPAKNGIGSAHQDGIARAYDLGYDTLVTMDCDFTHSPTDIPAMLDKARTCDIACGSRHTGRESLPGWSLTRRIMTKLGHQLTKRALRIRYDATGAFRVYRLKQVPRELFTLVSSRGYAFFFESMFVFDRNGMNIGEVPIVLPSRTAGHSKMSYGEIVRSLKQIAALFWAERRNPSQFKLRDA